MMTGGPSFPSPPPQVLQTWQEFLGHHGFATLSFQCLPVQHIEVSVLAEGEQSNTLDTLARFALTTIAHGEGVPFFSPDTRPGWQHVLGPTLDSLTRAKLVAVAPANSRTITDAGKIALQTGVFRTPITCRQVVSILDLRPWESPRPFPAVESAWLRPWPDSNPRRFVLMGDALRAIFPELPMVLDGDWRHIPIVQMQYLPVVMRTRTEPDQRQFFVINVDDWSIVRMEPIE